MIAYNPTASKPASISLKETTTPALGGVSGEANIATKELGDYCAYLEDLLTSHADLLATLGVLPLAALDYPTLDGADNKWAVTADSATNGGTVAVSEGKKAAIAAEIAAGVSGRMGYYTSSAYESADLAVSSTYYLRGQIDTGALVLYVQKGTDADAIPAGLKGVPDGSSGGGFDSTVLDVLIAKVVTSTAGTVPTVTPLANAARLVAIVNLLADGASDVATALDWDDLAAGTHTLNWARTPTAEPYLAGYGGTASQPSGISLNPGGVGDSSQVPKVVMIRKKSTSSRYTLLAEYAYQDSSGDHGTISLIWTAHA